MTPKVSRMKTPRSPRVLLPVLLLLAVSPVSAETVIEAWRSPFGTPRSVSVSPTDGSCWAATGNTVMHLSHAGLVLAEIRGFNRPSSVCVNPADGSCWVADTENMRVVHLAQNGDTLWSADGFSMPMSVSVNPVDGSCWVAEYSHHAVIHLAADGTELWRGAGFTFARSVAVNPTDGSCWVAVQGTPSPPGPPGPSDYLDSAVVHLAGDGTELSRVAGFNGAWYVAADPTDGSCWVADYLHDQVVKLSKEGGELWRGSGFSHPTAVSVNPADGSCWVADRENSRVVRLSASGPVLWSSDDASGFLAPIAVSVNPSDGSCWVGDYLSNDVVCLASDGTELLREGAFSYHTALAANSQDGSCWVSDLHHNRIVRLDASGAAAWQGGNVEAPTGVSVNATDGSCWVTDWGHSQVVHLAESGDELWRGGGWDWPSTLGGDYAQVSPNDGTCWVADVYDNQVVHLAESGAELWRGTILDTYLSMSVNASDGSVWVSSTYGLQHLAGDGTELWRGAGGVHPAENPAVDAGDGSCWVTVCTATRAWAVRHLAANGTELWTGWGRYYAPRSLSVNPWDGSCWVANTDLGEVVHLAADGTELWRGRDFDAPWGVSVDAGNGSCWVADTGNGQVAHLVIEAEPGAGFATWPRAGTAPLDVTFTDRSTGNPTSWHWEFGDGATSTEQNPGHTYTSAGHHTVALTATGDFGTDTETENRLITVSFPDVPLVHWASVHIIACVDLGIVSGYPDGTYGPIVPVTRDQMAVYVARALAGGDVHVPTHPAQVSFPDMPADHWAYKYVEYSQAMGIVTGYPDGTYGPTTTLDRGQMAVFIARSIATPTGEAGMVGYIPPTRASFPDVPTSFWAYKYIEFIRSKGVTSGYPDGLYHPEYACTRDQMAVYVARAFKLPL